MARKHLSEQGPGLSRTFSNRARKKMCVLQTGRLYEKQDRWVCMHACTRLCVCVWPCVCTCMGACQVCGRVCVFVCVSLEDKSACSCLVTPTCTCTCLNTALPYGNPRVPAPAVAKPPARPHSSETNTRGKVICSRPSVSLREMPTVLGGGQPGSYPTQEISADCFKISSASTQNARCI